MTGDDDDDDDDDGDTIYNIATKFTSEGYMRSR
jgi:hypothetical protein